MANISDILKAARERANLSIEDLSEQTKIRPNIIESIEKNDFSNFQVVYLKAYIRNLAKELQIESDPEFLEA
jgi:cytoskeletal protein RodZ